MRIIGLVPFLILVILLISGCTQQEMEDVVSKSFTIPAGASFCINGVITVSITNTGTETIRKEDFTIKVDGSDASRGLEDDIEPVETGLFSWDCGGACSSGSHAVYLETVSSTLTINVDC